MASAKAHLTVDSKTCAGCRACELACSFHHTGTYDPCNSRIRVDKDESLGKDTPHVCVQCDAARCIASCPVGALRKDPVADTVLLEAAICVSCGACVTACGGSLHAHSLSGVPLFCDLCSGEPRCVKRCPTSALTFTSAEGGK